MDAEWAKLQIEKRMRKKNQIGQSIVINIIDEGGIYIRFSWSESSVAMPEWNKHCFCVRARITVPHWLFSFGTKRAYRKYYIEYNGCPYTCMYRKNVPLPLVVLNAFLVQRKTEQQDSFPRYWRPSTYRSRSGKLLIEGSLHTPRFFALFALAYRKP